jgi:hypothetical protein
METGNAKHAIHLVDLTADHYFGERQETRRRAVERSVSVAALSLDGSGGKAAACSLSEQNYAQM